MQKVQQRYFRILIYINYEGYDVDLGDGDGDDDDDGDGYGGKYTPSYT
jgi:hypothetical protein